MKQLTEKQSKLHDEIVNGQNPMCLYALDQPLVDQLCDIIRIKAENIDEMDELLENE